MIRSKNEIIFRMLLIPLSLLSLIILIFNFYSGKELFTVTTIFFSICTCILILKYQSNHNLNIKILLLLLFNLSIFQANQLVTNGGLYFYYLPLMLAPFSIFESNQKAVLFLCSLVSLSCLIYFSITDFSSEHSNESIFKYAFIVNLFNSLVILIYTIYFSINLAEKFSQKLMKRNRKLGKKNNELKSLNNNLQQLIYTTSHDIHSPLASLQGLIYIAEKNVVDKEVQGYFHKILQQVKNIENSALETLEFYNYELKEPTIENVDLHSMVSEIIESYSFLGHAEKITYNILIPEKRNYLLNRHCIKTILRNLISNSIKYHDYHKEKCIIEISVTENEECISIVIKDNGKGISSGHADKIFDKFYRIPNQSVKGTGLGLYIVKQAVKKLKGSIVVDSKEKEWTSFVIQLPKESAIEESNTDINLSPDYKKA